MTVATVPPAITRRPPARPRDVQRPIYRSGRVYVAITAVLIVVWALVIEVQEVSDWVRSADEATVTWIADHRLDELADAIDAPAAFAADWLWRVLRWGVLAVLLIRRRFRYLAVYVAVTVGVTAVAHVVADIAERGAPAVAWPGIAVGPSTHPSRVVIELGLSVVGAMYTLVAHGRRRNQAKVFAGVVVGSVIASRVYLTAEYPTDLVVGLVLGMAVPVVLYRFLSADASWTTHDIEEALAGQRGWRVHSIEPLRPPGSAGSTPIRITVSDASLGDGSPWPLFAKLYSLGHLRSDRWYKLLRAVLYGRLEDEMPFADVRHLVEHEDYMLRVAADGGLSVPRTFGIVEVRRGSDYLLLMEWLPDSRQLDERVVTDDVIDQAFSAVAQLWRMGIAHRDVKPANIVVADGRLYLVDLSFGELVASTWRREVDLGAMTLCLALYAEPDVVIARARRWFTDGELAEGLAATRSVTIPAQLRALLREAGSDVVGRCRSLLPPRASIHVQRWSFARVTLTLAVTGCTLAVGGLAAYSLARSGLL